MRKKKASKSQKPTRGSQEPTARSLREMPEIDFSRYRVRRNPYAKRIQREGVELVHDGPSAASLREIPEIDVKTARIRRNPYVIPAERGASRASEGALTWQYGRGRPMRGQEVGPTAVRSVRLPAAAWKRLDREARARRTSTHALLRDLIGQFLERLR